MGWRKECRRTSPKPKSFETGRSGNGQDVFKRRFFFKSVQRVKVKEVLFGGDGRKKEMIRIDSQLSLALWRKEIRYESGRY